MNNNLAVVLVLSICVVTSVYVTYTVDGGTINMENQSIIADWSGEGVTNVGHIDFADNLFTPIAPLSIYSDGVDLFANTGGKVVNLSDIAPQTP